jgi:hypothetical protein
MCYLPRRDLVGRQPMTGFLLYILVKDCPDLAHWVILDEMQASSTRDTVIVL